MRPYEIAPPGGEPASRRQQLLAEAARLFAARGYRAVGIDDIGEAAGISGPAIYRHFERKEEILAALLVGISQHMHEGGTTLAGQFKGAELVDRLVDFQLDFSLNYSDLIVLHDRALDDLEPASRHEVRRVQRAYVAMWVDALCEARSDFDEKEAKLRAQACFGLLNSTPHLQLGVHGQSAREVLARMARAALYT